MASDEKPKAHPVKLLVTVCSSVYTGTNSRGDNYTIYEVKGNKENGEPVAEKLRSFEDLPIGELLDLTVTKFESEKHGTSYTLARKNKPNSHQRITDLKAEVDHLRERVEKLERGGGQPVAATQSAAQQEDLDARFGSEPPF